jgi:hypothetical protein
MGCFLANSAVEFYGRVVKPALNPAPGAIVHLTAHLLGFTLKDQAVYIAPWVEAAIAIALAWAGIYLIARRAEP